MVAHVDTDTLLFELDQRRRQAAMSRAARRYGRKPGGARLKSSPAAGRLVVDAFGLKEV